MLIDRKGGHHKRDATQQEGQGNSDLFLPYYRTPEARFGLYSCQRVGVVEELAGYLKEGAASIVVLSGPEGIGRSYALEAALWERREAGQSLEREVLDLEGYEPELPISSFLQHHLRAHGRAGEMVCQQVHEEVGPLLENAATSAFTAAIASSIFSLRDPFAAIAELEGHQDLFRSELPGREALSLYLQRRTQDRRLLLHVRDAGQLADPLQRSLVEEAERLPNLVLALSVRPEDSSEAVAPPQEGSRTPQRLELRPLNEAELRHLLEERFRPNILPDDLAIALFRASDGWPARLANRVYRLVRNEGLIEDRDGTWHLPEAGMKAPQVLASFSDFYHQLGAFLETLPGAGRQVRDFLCLASLCGPCFPADLLLEHLGIGEDLRDEILDVIDDHLVGEEGSGILLDLQYSHAGFPEHSVYRFSNAAIPASIRRRLSADECGQRADELLRFLRPRLPARTRGVVGLYLSLKDHLPNPGGETGRC